MTNGIGSSWRETIADALDKLSAEYREFLSSSRDYIPNNSNFLNSFKTLPKDKVQYILFGQDPYPREQSATGYAFIDGGVENIFSPTGLSKEVNKATSLRNFVKMSLVADGLLDGGDSSQNAISQIDKSSLIDSIDELRINFEHNGVLLLNTALVFTDKKDSTKHIKQWRAFVECLLSHVKQENPKLILFGSYAKQIQKLANADSFGSICLEHPYNHTFINNAKAHELFGKMQLLRRRL